MATTSARLVSKPSRGYISKENQLYDKVIKFKFKSGLVDRICRVYLTQDIIGAKWARSLFRYSLLENCYTVVKGCKFLCTVIAISIYIGKRRVVFEAQIYCHRNKLYLMYFGDNTS